MMTSSVQSRIGSDSSVFTASPSPPHIHIHSKRHKKHKSKSKHNKSSRSRSYGEVTITSYPDTCNHRHCKKSKSHKYLDDVNTALYEPETVGHNIRDSDDGPVNSLIVSIPRFHNVNKDRTLMVAESPQQNVPIMGTPSSSVEQNALPSNITNALSAIMAEPVPSNCIHVGRIGSTGVGMQDTGNIQNQG